MCVCVCVPQHVHHYNIEDSENCGRYICTTMTIPKDSLVMVVPPNLLYTLEEMPHCNQGLQVSEVLYSCSLSDEDMDNFLNHSCDPTCSAVIRDDFTVLLYARRDIAAGESITVDYEQFELDLLVQHVDFHCECGATTCRCVDLPLLCAWLSFRGSRCSFLLMPCLPSGHIIGAKYHKVAPVAAAEADDTAGKPRGMLWADLPATVASTPLL